MLIFFFFFFFFFRHGTRVNGTLCEADQPIVIESFARLILAGLYFVLFFGC